VVDIIEAKAREKKMVTVQSGEMAKAIADTGRIALYGIYLTSTKPTSNPNPILRLSR
jgi:OOP family OmpA-OmpF porin